MKSFFIRSYMDFFERLALGQPVIQDAIEPALTKLVAWEERLGLLGEG